MHAVSEPARPPVLDGDVAHGTEPCALAAAYAGPRDAEGAVLYEKCPKNAVHRPALEAVERPGVGVAEGPPGGDLPRGGLYARPRARNYLLSLGLVRGGEEGQVVLGHDRGGQAHVFHAQVRAEAAAVFGGVAGLRAAGEEEIHPPAALPGGAAQQGLHRGRQTPAVRGRDYDVRPLRGKARRPPAPEQGVQGDDLVPRGGGNEPCGVQAVARAGKAEYHVLASFAFLIITRPGKMYKFFASRGFLLTFV